MPVTKYQYLVTDTANDKVYIPTLTDEINGDASITVQVDANSGINVNVEPGKLDIYMADLLTAPQETALTAAVAAHQGVGYVSTMQGTLQVVNFEHVVTEDVNWDDLEGLVTTPSFFSLDVNQIVARVVGEYKTTGTGAQLRIMEGVDGQPDEEKLNPFYSFADTAGVWTRFAATSNVPPRDYLHNLYCVGARLNGATALSLRFATISMLKVIVV